MRDMRKENVVVVSYPRELSGWAQLQLETPWFIGYLRRTLGEIREGDVREEFVDVGCCGHSPTIELRIESPGTAVVDEDTTIRFIARESATG